MRIGINPEKEKSDLLYHAIHRIIIPVYIPSNDGYFKDSFEILKICLRSLFESIGKESKVTIVNNNCSKEVNNYLNELLVEGYIDQYIVNKENRGKVESVLNVARASFEEFITISDADILFYRGWFQKAVRGFTISRKVGVVSLLTFPHLSYYCNFTTILDNLMSLKIRAGKVVSREVIDQTYYSIGKSKEKIHKMALEKKQLYCRHNNEIYLLSCNHAAAVYKREVFLTKSRTKIEYAFNHKYKAVRNFIDMPIDKAGFWRISFPSPLCYHMGNELESWFKDSTIRGGVENSSNNLQKIKPARASWIRFIPYQIRSFFAILSWKFLT